MAPKMAVMAVRPAIPDTNVVEPSAPRGRRVSALFLALLLPFALAACGEADQEEDAPGPPTEESEQAGDGERQDESLDGSLDDLPLFDFDSEEVVLPEVVMPMDADPGADVMPLALPEPPEMPAAASTAASTAATTTKVRALDKITARVIDLDLPEDIEVRFGTLAIRARTCRSRPPEEPPETFAFLEIDDVKMNEERERIFSGWMMASSPALNALEHPVYDVWVIACKRSSAGASSARK